MLRWPRITCTVLQRLQPSKIRSDYLEESFLQLVFLFFCFCWIVNSSVSPKDSGFPRPSPSELVGDCLARGGGVWSPGTGLRAGEILPRVKTYYVCLWDQAPAFAPVAFVVIGVACSRVDLRLQGQDCRRQILAANGTIFNLRSPCRGSRPTAQMRSTP